MPAGADAIVIQEQTQRQGNQVQILAAPEPQAFVRHRGAFCQPGDVLLPHGVRLNAPELAVLASAQWTQIPVYRRPQVALLSTGGELVAPDQPLGPGQIVDSNQYALAHLVTQSIAVPQRLGVVEDTPKALKQAIRSALAGADGIISSGGVSVGDYDYVDQVLADLGAEIHVRAVAVKPGKPLTFATFAGEEGRPKFYFGLPGNPVSALVCFWRFVQPVLSKLSGLAQGWEPLLVQATTRQALKADGKRETYLWGRLYPASGSYEFEPASGSHSSGNLINLAQTNGLAVLPIGQPIAAGEAVQVLWIP
jgi:molybdopterin molybdotransferase